MYYELSLFSKELIYKHCDALEKTGQQNINMIANKQKKKGINYL